MKHHVYYVFVPTPALAGAAREAGEAWALDPDVWTDEESDRMGRMHSQEEVETAFWTVFLAKLVSDPPEPESARRFRERCLELGYAGCWTLNVASQGAPVDELLSEAREVAPLAAAARRSK